MSLGLILFGISQIFYGPIADYIGRIYAAKIGISIFIFGSIVCIFSTSCFLFALGRLIQGMGIGCVGVVGRALIRDVFSGKELLKYTSYLAMGMAITPVISPLLGGYIQENFGWKTNFFVLILVATVCLFILLNYFEETLEIRKKIIFKDIIYDYKKLILSPQLIGLCLVNMLSFSGEIYFSILAPFLIQLDYGYSAQSYGIIVFLTVPFFIAGNKIVTILLNKMEVHKITIIGISIQAISGVILILSIFTTTKSIYFLMLPVACYALGIGIVTPTTTASSMQIFPKNAGIAGAISGCFAMAGSGCVTLFMSSFFPNNQISLGSAFFVISIINAFIMLSLWKRLKSL